MSARTPLQPASVADAGALDSIAETVRRRDPDRFLTALFTPPGRRADLLLLYAFNTELARAREATSQPTLTLIRLHWWREVIEGAIRRHEIAERLQAAISEGRFDAADLLALIDAREAEAAPSIPTLDAWRDYLLGTAGGVMVAAGKLLGIADAERLRGPGAAYGAAGVLRAVPVLARQGRCLLPDDVLEAHGSSSAMLIEGAVLPDGARAALLAEGRRLLPMDAPGRLPRQHIAAVLPAVLAGRDLDRSARSALPRGIGDRLAVARAWWTQRLPI